MGVTIRSFRDCNMHKRVDMPRELNIQPTGVSLPISKGHVVKSDSINLQGCLYLKVALFFKYIYIWVGEVFCNNSWLP